MNMRLIAITLAALALAPALTSAELAPLLDEAAAVKPGDAKAWLAVRGRILELGQDALPELKAAGADDEWTQSGWVRAMAAKTCATRLENAELAEAADQPEGLDPKVYGLYRKPEPACQHQLRHLGKDAVPLLLERWRWTLEDFTYSKGEPGKLERECFGRAIMFVPGALEDRRARFALEAAARDIALPDTWRQDAAVSLGQTGGLDALATLKELFDRATETTAVREACGWAMGRIADIDAAAAIETRLAADGLSLELKRALIVGAGILGSAWAWEARGPMHRAAGDEVRARCAAMLVEALKALPAQSQLIGESLAMAAWPDSLDTLKALAQEGETAEVRDAAKTCLPALKSAIDRNSK